MQETRATSAVCSPRLISSVWAIIVVGVTIAVLGCGCRKTTDTRFVPVSGRITLDGQPLVQGSICFRSKNDEISAITDADGHYRLYRGAAPDDYRVSITIVDLSRPGTTAMEPGAIGRPTTQKPTATAPIAPARPKQAVPACYSDPQQTELRFTVGPSGTDSADFALKSKQ